MWNLDSLVRTAGFRQDKATLSSIVSYSAPPPGVSVDKGP